MLLHTIYMYMYMYIVIESIAVIMTKNVNF